MMKTLLPNLNIGKMFAALFVGMLLFAGSVTAQTTTFAQFVERNGTQDFVFDNLTSSATFSAVPGGSPIFFFYQNIAGLDPSLQGLQMAHLTVTATTTDPAVNNAGELTQPMNQTVVIRITRDSATAPGVGTGSRTVLLQATITPNSATAGIKGTSGGNSAVYDATTPNHTVVFASDFISFGATTARNLGLSFSSVTAGPSGLVIDGSFLIDFTAAATGTFASNPPPIPQVPTAAPVSIGGRVFAPNGAPLRNAHVVLTDSNGVRRVAYTSSMGFYGFDQVESGQVVTIEVVSKRYLFNAQVISLVDNVADLEFWGSDDR